MLCYNIDVEGGVMSDQCLPCVNRGNYRACLGVPCSIRESWFVGYLMNNVPAPELMRRVELLEKVAEAAEFLIDTQECDWYGYEFEGMSEFNDIEFCAWHDLRAALKAAEGE
jgi:hypothetical protein